MLPTTNARIQYILPCYDLENQSKVRNLIVSQSIIMSQCYTQAHLVPICLLVQEIHVSCTQESIMPMGCQYFTDRSKAVLPLYIFMFFLSCVCYAFVRV